jgi:hypothetical protein
LVLSGNVNSTSVGTLAAGAGGVGTLGAIEVGKKKAP